MAQHHIVKPGFLHDEKGRLIEPGYATNLIQTYDRKRIAANPLRIKEWDYYYIGNDNFGLALTIADNGYMSMDSISLLDFEHGWEQTTSRMGVLPLGKRKLPPTSECGDIHVKGKDYEMTFKNDGVKRSLFGSMENFRDGKPIVFDVELRNAPRDSMVIVTPFKEDPKAFYYNQKINCMRASGWIKFDGKKYEFDPKSDFGTLDWGRGVWTYDNTWFWGSGNADVDGNSFGWNIGYGFGDTSAASENILFWNGKAHKLDDVTFNIPESGYMDTWTFTSSDSRFEMTFEPVLDRAANLDFKVIVSDQHQVFGKMSGKAVLDDGTEINIKDVMCFAEKVHNKY